MDFENYSAAWAQSLAKEKKKKKGNYLQSLMVPRAILQSQN